MLTDLTRAIFELRDPRVRGVLWRGIGLALFTLIGLVFGIDAFLDWAATTGYVWIDRIVEVLGVLGSLVVAWFLFPSIIIAVSSLFLDRVVAATEARYYPNLPPPREVPMTEEILAALRLLGIVLLVNLLALPLYFIPLLNLPIWLALNGYLVGREYFELVAIRRYDPARIPVVRRQQRVRFWLAGIVIAFLLAVPLLNLLAPMLGASFMTHRFHRRYDPSQDLEQT